MKMTLGLLTAALALTAGMAHAGTSIKTGTEMAEFDTDGAKTSYSGTVIEVEGAYDNVVYGVDVKSGELGETDMQSISTELGYLVNGHFGPKLKHDWTNVDGVKESTTLAGVTGKYGVNDDLGIYGDMLFGEDDVRVAKLGAAYNGFDRVDLWGELNDNDTADIRTKGVELGANYHVDAIGSVYAKVFRSWDDAAVETKGTGVGAGLNLAF